MTKYQILVKIHELLLRLKTSIPASKEMGIEVKELEVEISYLEVEFAEIIDKYMAIKYKNYNQINHESKPLH